MKDWKTYAIIVLLAWCAIISAKLSRERCIAREMIIAAAAEIIGGDYDSCRDRFYEVTQPPFEGITRR